MKCRKAYHNEEKFKEYRNKYNKRYYGRTENAPNNYQPWTDEENILVCRHIMTDTELSKSIGRGVRAIQMHRAKLKAKGLIEKYLDQAESEDKPKVTP